MSLEVTNWLKTRPLSLMSHGGRVRVWQAEEVVNATTTGGNIEVNFVGQPQADSTLVAQAGSIRVGYHDELNMAIAATTQNGKIKSPFASGGGRSLNHQLNDGQTGLKVTANSGGIRFRELNLERLQRDMDEYREEQHGRRAFQRAYQTHMAGRIEEAIELHKRAATFTAYRGIATYNLGCALALNGEAESALEALAQAYDYGFRDREQYESDSDLDSLRDLAAFKELMQRLNNETDDCVDDDDDSDKSSDY